jgi:hypothetical protein
MKRVTRKHGLSRTPEYRAWQTMRLRCTNPENAACANYGARGITVCAEWLDDPARFVVDMGPKPSPAHEIDRIDNDAGYSPGNCRWVLRSENDRNRRNNTRIDHEGETLTQVEWAERTGIRADTIQARISAGWPISEALTIPTRAKGAKGERKADQRNACADCGKACLGQRCITCSNKSRAKALVRALMEDA